LKTVGPAPIILQSTVLQAAKLDTHTSATYKFTQIRVASVSWVSDLEHQDEFPRDKASGFRLQASGFRLQASGMGLFYIRVNVLLLGINILIHTSIHIMNFG
jgi:hypothetical protein